jgi:hypothetical protein
LLFVPAYQLLAPTRQRRLLVRDDTELVIEGFPRSANSFSVAAFGLSQDRRVQIAHHLHAEAQVMEGVRRGLPTCVLIRDPDEAVRSLLVRTPQVGAAFALRRYVDYYSRLLAWRQGFLVAPFQRVTGDFASLVVALNRRFGRRYQVPVCDDAFMQKVFARIRETNRRLWAGKATHIGIPSREREQALAGISLKGHQKALDQARRIHDDYLRQAETDGVS